MLPILKGQNNLDPICLIEELDLNYFKFKTLIMLSRQILEASKII